jgi:hypothetical protein
MHTACHTTQQTNKRTKIAMSQQAHQVKHAHEGFNSHTPIRKHSVCNQQVQHPINDHQPNLICVPNSLFPIYIEANPSKLNEQQLNELLTRNG